jgi:hypothetical protein
MLTISASKAYPGCAVVSGSQCAGVITLEELRQLASFDGREELISLIAECESPIETCERASEHMLALAAELKARS